MGEDKLDMGKGSMDRVGRTRKVTVVWRAMRKAFVGLRSHDPLRLAGATAFFATFALPPILIILTQTLGFIFKPKDVNTRLAEHLRAFFGKESVAMIMQTLSGFRDLAVNWYIAIGGFIFLLFVATTVFKVIRDTINQLWFVKAAPGRNVPQKMLPRLKSIAIIMVTGMLFIVGLLAEAMQAVLNPYIRELWSYAGSAVVIGINQVLSLLIVTVWFTILFRLLPEGKPQWRVAWTGGLFTGLLFTTGKLILGTLLGLSNIQNIYGAAGSFVLVLLFVFYVSFIFYYGAMFTYYWGEETNRPIEPARFGIHIDHPPAASEKKQADLPDPPIDAIK